VWAEAFERAIDEILAMPRTIDSRLGLPGLARTASK
jgi:hypothetical protein